MKNKCEYKKSNIKFKIVDVKGKCKYNYKKNKTINLNKILPRDLCPSALYIVFPYYFTLVDNGWFRWERNKNSVIAQCPNPDGIVMKISGVTKNNERSIDIKIIEKGGGCPRDYKINDIFNLDPKNLNGICPKLFGIIYPYNLLNKTVSIGCPSFENKVVIKLIKNEKNKN